MMMMMMMIMDAWLHLSKAANDNNRGWPFIFSFISIS